MPNKESITRQTFHPHSVQAEQLEAERQMDRDRLILRQGGWHVAWTRDHLPAENGNDLLTNTKTWPEIETHPQTAQEEIAKDGFFNHALSAGKHVIVRTLVRILDLLHEWSRRSRDRKLLREMDERMLKDIASSWHAVERESSKPFWKK